MKLATRVQATSKKVTLIATAFVLAVSTLATALPFMAAQNASAVGASAVVYDALPSTTPSTNYPSYGAQAHKFNEFGDRVQLEGVNRGLESVSVVMSAWAKESSASSVSWCANPLNNCDEDGFTYPITLNVYKTDSANPNGVGEKIATQTKDVSVPWRPESDPTCGTTSNGNGWKEAGECVEVSGLAFTTQFNFSGSVELPDEIVLGVAYNTRTFGAAPTGVAGPVDSLNITFPYSNFVSAGADVDTMGAYVATPNPAYWGASSTAFENYESYPGYGTVAFRVTATNTTTPVVESITPGIGSFISGDAQKVYVNIENPEAMKGGFLMLNKAVETGTPLNSDRKTYPLQEDGAGWYALVDTTVLTSGADYLVKVEAHGTQTPWGYYGNGSAWLSPSYALTVDNTGPTMTSVKINGKAATIAPRADNCGPTAFNRVHGQVSLTATINDGTGVGVDSASYKIRKVTDGGCTQASVYSSSTVAMQQGAGDEWTTLPGAGLDTTLVPADGNYTIMVTSKDAFNNPTTQYVDITVDNERPAAAIDAPALTNESDPLIKGIASDNEGIKGHWFEIKAPNGTLYYVNSFLSNTTGEVSFHLSEAKGTVGGVANTPLTLEEGEYKIRYVVTDVTGNRSDDPAYSNSVIHTLVIDSTAPDVAVVDYTTAENVITPVVMNDDSTASFLWTPAASNPAVVTISDPTAQTPTFTATASGVYVFDLTATDLAGNSTVTPFSFTYTAPVAAIAAPVLLEEEENDDTTTPPITGFSNVFGGSTAIPEAETEPEEDVQGAADVAGSSTEDNLAAAVDTDGTDGTVFGLAWYWWLLILGVLAGIIWWIITALRGRQTEA